MLMIASGSQRPGAVDRSTHARYQDGNEQYQAEHEHPWRYPLPSLDWDLERDRCREQSGANE
jgi:hypothetical protein